MSGVVDDRIIISQNMAFLPYSKIIMANRDNFCD